MYGARRIYAHQLFCLWTGRSIAIEIFCQYVDKKYDEGSIICSRFYHISFTDDPEKIGKELLADEHDVQIEGRHIIALNSHMPKSPYNYADTPKNSKLIEKAKIAARDKYPPE